jgi:hypothetical protein
MYPALTVRSSSDTATTVRRVTRMDWPEDN